MVIKEISIILNNKCNESCWYCDIPNNSYINNKFDIKLFEKIMYLMIDYMEKSESFFNISLLGGEIGLLNIVDIYKIVNICNKLYDKYHNNKNFSINVYTNGLFLKKIKDIFDYTNICFTYHVLDKYLYTTNYINSDRIIYRPIATYENENTLIDFIKTGVIDNVNFRVKPCFSYRKNVKEYDIKNSPFSKFIKKEIKINNIECNRHSYYFCIDLSDNTLFKCCRSYVNAKKFELYELNKSNLDKAFKGNLFGMFDSIVCNNCVDYKIKNIKSYEL